MTIASVWNVRKSSLSFAPHSGDIMSGLGNIGESCDADAEIINALKSCDVRNA